MMASCGAALRVADLSKRFGRQTALQAITLNFRPGRLSVILGPSGCGKSTMLRLIAGLETPTSGQVFLDEACLNGKPPWQRDVAMVFQSYALYPHLTVFDNLAFPLRARRLSRAAIRERVGATARRLGLEGLLGRKPRQLSGGQRQRVALGRAIVRQPRVFLLDEPLSNLDARLRIETRAELKQLQSGLRITMVYVTHDQEEAMTLADDLIVMRDGRVEQVGTPRAVYLQPATTFVARFLGNPPMNLLRCQVLGSDDCLQVGDQSLGPGPAALRGWRRRTDDREVAIGIRPESVTLTAPGDAAPTGLRGTIMDVQDLGRELVVRVRLDQQDMIVLAGPTRDVHPGQPVGIQFDPTALRCFDPTTGRSIAAPD
jgi:multiple sugar transport system ATP-binding protein